MHIHPYEKLWIRLSAVLLVVFALAIAVSNLALGIEIPGVEQRIEQAATGRSGAPMAEPGIRQLGPGRYEVTLQARAWGFQPDEIRIPVGSTVTFYIESMDVLHGMKILNTTVSLMVIPGQLGKATYTFKEPGEYLFVCHEYCGMGHHIMHGRIIVEES